MIINVYKWLGMFMKSRMSVLWNFMPAVKLTLEMVNRVKVDIKVDIIVMKRLQRRHHFQKARRSPPGWFWRCWFWTYEESRFCWISELHGGQKFDFSKSSEWRSSGSFTPAGSLGSVLILVRTLGFHFGTFVFLVTVWSQSI